MAAVVVAAVVAVVLVVVAVVAAAAAVVVVVVVVVVIVAVAAQTVVVAVAVALCIRHNGVMVLPRGFLIGLFFRALSHVANSQVLLPVRRDPHLLRAGAVEHEAVPPCSQQQPVKGAQATAAMLA